MHLNKSKQTTTQFKISHILPDKSLIEVRNSTNHFKRNIFLNNYSFAGTQFSSFSEISYSKDRKNQNFIIGINLYSDKFTEQPIDTDTIELSDEEMLSIFGRLPCSQENVVKLRAVTDDEKDESEFIDETLAQRA